MLPISGFIQRPPAIKVMSAHRVAPLIHLPTPNLQPALVQAAQINPFTATSELSSVSSTMLSSPSPPIYCNFAWSGVKENFVKRWHTTEQPALQHLALLKDILPGTCQKQSSIHSTHLSRLGDLGDVRWVADLRHIGTRYTLTEESLWGLQL